MSVSQDGFEAGESTHVRRDLFLREKRERERRESVPCLTSTRLRGAGGKRRRNCDRLPSRVNHGAPRRFRPAPSCERKSQGLAGLVST